MLGSLAKWLRIFGVDTFYPTTEASDDELLHRAQQEHRLMITRDKELIRRAKKEQVPVLEINTTDLDEQLCQVLAAIPINPAAQLTRCTICNNLLSPIEKNKLKEQVPKKVFETKDEFWVCNSCQRYYWMGTHYENMIQKIHALTKNNGT
jgi:uncharacterized protein with PIN domain